MVPTHSHKPWTKTTVFWMKHLLYLHLLNIKISGWLCGMYTQQSYWQQAMYACFNKTVQRWKLFHPSKWMYVVIFWFYEVSWWSFHTKMTKWQKKNLTYYVHLKKKTYFDTRFLSFGLTVSLIVAGVVWFILVAEEGGRQQELPG